VFSKVMALERITRRRVLGAGATVAAGALVPPASFARHRPALFERSLTSADLDSTVARAAAADGWRTTKVLRAPRRFDLIGLRWAPGSAVEAQVRARTRRGQWTQWVSLHVLGDHAPDGGTRVAGTDPAWTDSADLFQFRLRGRARGVRVRFVRAKPTATVARAATSRLRRRARASASGRARTAQSSEAPRIVTRREWGGDSVRPRADPDYGRVQLAFVHHTVTANDYGPEDSASIVLGIARYHRDSNGWNDIGYNFLVDKYGQVFEGRAGGVEAAVVGAQAQGYNTNSTGIACLGDYRAIGQSPAGLSALAELIAWKLSLHGCPTQGQVTVTSAGGASNRYKAGTPVTFQRISGHRDGDETTCPGDGLYAQLPALRERAGQRQGSLPAGAVASAALTIRAAAARVRYPAPVQLSGRLSFGGGQSPAGATLTVEFQPAGGGWQKLRDAIAGPDGSWSAQVELPASGSLRARFAGDDERPPVLGAPVAVTVLPSLSLALSARRIRRRAAVAVTGTLSPRPAGGRVTCTLERQVRGSWVLVQRKRINVRSGVFSTRVRPRVAGLYRVTVSTPGATKRLSLRVVDRSAGVTGGASSG